MTEVNNKIGKISTAQEVLTIARSWIGTPYCHQASSRGSGTDCLGLLRGIWRELYGSEPEIVPAYSVDWSERLPSDYLLKAAARNFELVEPSAMKPGDVLILRMRRFAVAKHIGILAESDLGYSTIIHAYSGHGVVESVLTPVWMRSIAGVFRFP